jgi:beta-fructofuranosidase
MNRRTFLLSSAAFCALPAARADQLQKKLMHDPLRPQFHLLPKANWMNDPCAPRFFQGQYHMFFQYNPGAAVWGDMHWNHAVSPDMIHWKHLPLALAPTAGGYDAAGCFTGSVLPGMDVPTILYTGVTRSSPETIRGEGLREVQCLATSTDPQLRVWKKLDKPVLESPPPGLQVTGFRDPCPWKEGDTWYMGVGSGFTKTGGAVLLYSSRDGRNWTYLHPLAQGKWNGSDKTNPVATGEMWECPDFFPLDGKHVLLYSTEGKVYWEVGTFEDLRFHSETRGLLDHGAYYAMKSMVDAQGRRILWGWVQETRSQEEMRAAGWSGAMALPRLLSIGSDNRLRMSAPPEFAALDHGSRIENRAGHVAFRFKADKATCGLELRAGNTRLFAVEYDGNQATVGGQVVNLAPDDERISTVDIWIDGSVIETFVDSRQAITARCYTATSEPIEAVWTGAADARKSLTVSAVTPISTDRLTT